MFAFIMGLLLIMSMGSAVANDFPLPPNARDFEIRIFCFTPKGLASRLQKVTNEQQIFNNDEKIWHSKDGCAITRGQPTTTDRRTAAKYKVFKPHQLGGFVGWIVTEKFLIPVEHFVFIDKENGVKGWRPAYIFSRDRYTLPNVCFERVVTDWGPPLFGHQFSAGNPIDDSERDLCRAPILKNQVTHGRHGEVRKRPMTPEQQRAA